MTKEIWGLFWWALDVDIELLLIEKATLSTTYGKDTQDLK